ncbi:hypothetical protein QAD02_022813 [Eretmocerus hayati]|uniref:Uncharacterized protein n=1 Tax=Eretmocerus hayati TaxID=131215 RepID=A0ACC2PWK4_9HYME|nr:hypothetical protein QAD02_022813 [Eretmocerus hayati]
MTSIKRVSVSKNGQINHSDIAGYHLAIGVPRFLLRALGAWPDPEMQSNTSSLHFFIVASSMASFIIIPQTVKIYKSMTDINTVIDLFVNCDVPVTIGFIKLFSAWYHRSVLRGLLVNMIEDWQTPRPERESKIMWKNARLCRIISVSIFLLNNACVVTQIVQWANDLQEFKSTKLSSNNSDIEEWPLYFQGSFPYNTQRTPMYELTILCQIISVSFASVSYQSTDPLFIILMLHLIGQLTILKMAVSELPDGTAGTEGEEGFVKRLTAVHTAHNRLWR